MSVADHPLTVDPRFGVGFTDEGIDVSRSVLADSAAAVGDELAARIRNARQWRSQYVDLVGDLTRCSARSRRTAMAIARSGLRSMSESAIFVRNGDAVSLSESLANHSLSGEIGTRVIRGRSDPSYELAVPYRGNLLRQASLLAQLERWVANGIVEPSFAVAIERVVAHPEWLSLPGRRIAITGAGSDLSPAQPLLEWGVDVLALDFPGPDAWTVLVESASRGAGQLRVPIRTNGKLGIDAVTELPELRDWLGRNGAEGLVLGVYVGADGRHHLRRSAAFDALAEHVLETVPGTALAYLATANDAFVVDETIANSARDAYDRSALAPICRLLTAGRGCGKAHPVRRPGHANVANGLLRKDGPEYAVARRLERWRGLTSVAAGHTVSFNVAPPVLTRSVKRHVASRAAARGFDAFGLEFFSPETARVLMAALLVHDLHQPAPVPMLNPEALFVEQALHGGMWRSGFEARSIVPMAAAIGLALPLKRVFGPR